MADLPLSQSNIGILAVTDLFLLIGSHFEVLWFIVNHRMLARIITIRAKAATKIMAAQSPVVIGLLWIAMLNQPVSRFHIRNHN
jgi:hypothetical protein